ncbi:hypothetical protein OY671_009034, partial [Metschnikowia pulcherrima]
MATYQPLGSQAPRRQLTVEAPDWQQADPASSATMPTQPHWNRALEEAVSDSAAGGMVRGPAHSSVGQEGGAVGSVSASEPQIMAWADRFASKENASLSGRGMHYPIASERALKLKEISYIHAEAYPAGELKHGPSASVTEHMPVVTIAPKDELSEKSKSNMQEVRARGGESYVFADADSKIQSAEGMHVIR